ncbi:hypothetical protein [Pseudomonas zhanjiangensis]
MEAVKQVTACGPRVAELAKRSGVSAYSLYTRCVRLHRDVL